MDRKTSKKELENRLENNVSYINKTLSKKCLRINIERRNGFIYIDSYNTLASPESHFKTLIHGKTLNDLVTYTDGMVTSISYLKF